MEYVIEAKHLSKSYGKQQVLTDVNLSIAAGEIVGVIGANGAGKSTLLKSILGLTRAQGELKVCGLSPIDAQHKLMSKVSFVADTAILPKWITPSQLFSYAQAVHPKFDLALAEEFIQQSEILPQQKVKKMSKGMVTQLHLALAVAINSDLLVLDEPTLGLDILRRKHFYQKLLEDHFDENNTIVITTHQIEEIENIITRLIYVDGGQVILDIQVNDLAARFVQLTILPPELDAVKALNPLCISATLSGIECIFDGVDKSQLEQYGSINTPNINNIVSAFMALQQEESRNV